ncbi:MAG TPA: glycosyltransferase, partial [Ktedonobacteraceae bacterium]
MKKHIWLQSWPRFLLWSHVIGVVGFYLVLWLRTAPGKEERVNKVPYRPENSGQSVSCPRVSVIVPARNEEHNIRHCIESLLQQDYANYEVIVVDDGSTDGTSRILDELITTHPHSNRLFVLQLRDDLPVGWAGKPHALHKGTLEAHGEWLLFTDADTWHEPGALRYSVTKALTEGIDLLSLGTEQDLPGFWNKVMMPMAYLGITMQYPIKYVNDPRSPVALANGQYILLRRAVYDILGGYARPDLRNTLLDDRDLARIVKENGYRLQLADGRGLVHVRMYRSLSETWRGWRKNVFLGSRGGLAFVLLLLIGLPVISIV